MRRHIQIHFPKFITEATELSGVAEVEDLTKHGNVKWDQKIVYHLAKILRKKVENLKIDARQWEHLLNDTAICNRETAIKIIFALNFGDATAAKFLISSYKNLFCMRNPADYLYNFCRKCKKCNFTYDTAIKLLKKFERGRRLFERTAPKNPLQNLAPEKVTTLLEDETTIISSNDKISPEEKQRLILKYMFKYRNEFVKKIELKGGKTKYPEGFSQQNTLKLKTLLHYLTILYPTFLQYEEVTKYDAFLFEKEIQLDKDGSPKSPIHLTKSMEDSQEIYIWELEEMAENGLTEDVRSEYMAIPFNAEIILPLKNLSQTIRSNLRIEHPNNAQNISRSTILFLAYFFICGCCAQDDESLNDLENTLDNDINANKNDSVRNNLRHALQNIIKNIWDLDKDNVDLNDNKNILITFVNSLNALLRSFNCAEFYAPFVIDRFILLCLLTVRRTENTDNNIPYLMSKFIEKSYSLSKKKMN